MTCPLDGQQVIGQLRIQEAEAPPLVDQTYLRDERGVPGRRGEISERCEEVLVMLGHAVEVPSPADERFH